MLNIYRWISSCKQTIQNEELHSSIINSEEAASIIAPNSTTGDPVCAQTVEVFLRCLGSEAANLATRYLPAGGVFIAGGVSQKMMGLLSDGRVAIAFRGKGRSVACYDSIPLFAVSSSGDELSMTGCCEALRAVSSCSTVSLSVHKVIEDASSYCVARIKEQLQHKRDLVLCVAAGKTPVPVYKMLSEAMECEHELFREIRILQLDEWRGLPNQRQHPSSCENFIRKTIIEPLKVSEERFIGFDGCATDGEAECVRVTQELEKWGGIDVALLGLGANGHLGFNEPKSSIDKCEWGAHVTPLSTESQSHTMVADQGVSCTEGITLGLGQVFAAKEILLLVTGEPKRQILSKSMAGTVSPEVPASLLRRYSHGKVTVVCDQEAIA